MWLPARTKDLSLLQSVYIVAGAHATSYLMDTGLSFPGIEETERETKKSSDLLEL